MNQGTPGTSALFIDFLTVAVLNGTMTPEEATRTFMMEYRRGMNLQKDCN